MAQSHEDNPAAETLVSVSDRFVRNQLKQARVALDNDDLEEARNYFQRALDIEALHLERENEIRQELKRYGELVTKREPPHWELAYQGLDLLVALELQNDETIIWRRDLQLKQANYLLEHKQQNESFDIFRALIAEHEQSSDRDEILAKIATILRENISHRAANYEWDSLSNMIKSIEELWPPGDGLHQWLETISKALAVAAQAPAKYKAEIEQLKRDKEELEGELARANQAKQRKQNQIYAVAGIFVIFYLILIWQLLSISGAL